MLGDRKLALYPVAMDLESALRQLAIYAESLKFAGLDVHQVALALDERQDGEPVTRVLLLVNDPKGQTWDLNSVTELRRSLAVKATELGLPSTSTSLVPDSDASSFETFVR